MSTNTNDNESRKLLESVESVAFRGIVRPVYDRVLRPRLPTKIASLNGVAVRRRRLFDANDVKPTLKEHEFEALRRLVEPEDHVVMIGGGWGIGSVVAARSARRGSVDVYEPSAEYAQKTKETAQLNRVADRMTVHEVAVGPPIDVWGDEPEDAIEVMSPADLPSHDVLYVDCEGAELDILEEMDLDARLAIVEAHICHGVSPDDVVAELEASGYQIHSSGQAQPDNPDIHAVVAVAEDAELPPEAVP